MKNKEQIKLFKLFTTSFFISLCTLGSGVVSLPLYRKKVVDEFKWMSQQEMSDTMAIAQCSPGAIMVNIAVCLGYQLRGVTGMAVMVLGTLLPPFVLMILVQDVYQQFSGDPLIVALFRGMNAAVSAVLISVVVSMIKEIKDNRVLSYLLLAIAFSLVYFLKVSPVWVILGGIVLALFISLWRKR